MKKTLTFKPQLAGFYKIEAVKQDGSRRVLADWFPNLILDTGLERLGTGSIMDRCQVGSGNTPPTVLDTALETLVATTTTQQANADGAQASEPYYGYQRRTFRFAEGAAAGTLAEVGVGWNPGLFSRALIVDAAGAPTTITVLSDEFLDVTYELRNYPPLVDSNFMITISGVEYTCVARAAQVTNGSKWRPPIAGVISVGASWHQVFDGVIGAITSNPNGNQGGASSSSFEAYEALSYRRDINTTWDLNSGNVAGQVSAVGFNTNNSSSSQYLALGAYQISFSPDIPKDNTKILSFRYRVQWARKTL